eukprot:1158273-Pelagomonas_calceolata.AAC.4
MRNTRTWHAHTHPRHACVRGAHTWHAHARSTHPGPGESLPGLCGMADAVRAPKVHAGPEGEEGPAPYSPAVQNAV